MKKEMKMNRLVLLSAMVIGFLAGITSKGNCADRLVFEENFDHLGTNGLPVGWEAWKPKNMAMLFESSASHTYCGKLSYRMTGNGKYHTKGCLRKKLEGFEAGKYYKFIVFFSTKGITNSYNTLILPTIKWGKGRNFRHIVPVEKKDGWYRAELIHQVTEDTDGNITLELFAGWIPHGSVYWGEVQVVELDGFAPATRLVHVAVIDQRPPKDCSLLQNCDFYVDQISHACEASPLDAICMTEVFNTLKVKPENDWQNAITMDSEYMQRLKNAAKKNKVNLLGSVLENERGILFNTGFLINRQGELVDKYHKAQLAMTEILYSDYSRGDELKVMRADFGTIGMAICWDYQFPEFTRTLALKGAEIIFVPIAGDGRMKKDTQCFGKAIAVENRIPIVFSTWAGNPRSPSWIINNEGEVVAISAEGKAYVSGTVDLNHKVYMWNHSDFSKAYFTSRRPELYQEITKDSDRFYTGGTY